MKHGDAFDPRLHYQSPRVAEIYEQERFASFGDRLFQRAGVRALSRALQVLGPEASLLDAACGTGRFSRELLNRGFHVTCADISHAMIEVARSRLDGADRRLHFSRVSADALPFCDEAFDAVVSMRFLPHIPTHQRRVMLGEMARVSRRWVIFSNTYSNRWYEYRRGLKRRLGHEAPTRYPVTEAQLREELGFAGLKEAGRFWTWRFLSEEVLMVCEKLSEGNRKPR
jgi:ubiquinone/menaquinone biosynthesis C-methylase UbiE